MKIHSSIGESNTGNSGKKWTVGDSNQSNKVIGREITQDDLNLLRQQAQEKLQQQENTQLQEGKKRIEILTGIGRKTRNVEINDDINGKIIFTLRTLKTLEQNCVSQVIETSERITTADGNVTFAPTSLFRLKVEVLAHSLFMIDGQSIDLVLGCINEEYSDKVEYRKELIQEMDNSLITHLFQQYQILSTETIDGYTPTNTEEVKEVVNTITKSS
jgi:hypothetical protein